MKNINVSYPAFGSAIVFYSMVAYQPVLLIKLLSFNLDKEAVMFFFSVYPIFFILAGIMYFRMPNKINDSTVIIFGAILSAVANMIMGLYQTGKFKSLD
mgnify:CR=1 FL=1